MENIWLLLMFSFGGLAGFLMFAMLQVSRGSGGKRQAIAPPILLSIDFEGDTLSRM
jgi:hypothetical protein